MKLLIVGIFAFLVLVYVYTFIKIRKKRKNKTNSVAEFNEKYLNKKINNVMEDQYYKKYITKYNSKIDYISKEDLGVNIK